MELHSGLPVATRGNQCNHFHFIKCTWYLVLTATRLNKKADYECDYMSFSLPVLMATAGGAYKITAAFIA